jgi:hypothetical protein
MTKQGAKDLSEATQWNDKETTKSTTKPLIPNKLLISNKVKLY